MSPIRVSEWRKLPLHLTELCIDTTLRCGQSFRWQKINDEWNCVLHGRLLSLRQDESFLHYKVTWPRSCSRSRKATGTPEGKGDAGIQQGDDTEALLEHYFSLKHDLASLYRQWSESDPNFKKKAPKFTGIRILTQDAWETLVAFICSSNNHISRISQMVNKLCVHYGPLIGHVGEEPFHDFPSPQALAGKKVEAHLRELGFGYRAKYIADTAMVISTQKPEGWLESLTNPENPGWASPTLPVQDIPITYKQAHEELLLLAGVGPKVADCVCLMGLGWSEAVPVDTHVWQIAQRDYHFGKTKTKTFSKAMYHSIGDHFRLIWGPQAGWAQSVLFTANLKSFSEQAAVNPTSANATVEVKQEEKSDPSPPARKRRASTIVQEVKVEIDEPLDVKPMTKRRRTRR
ncbi:putative N-glycosylase DNA lyase [Rosellinia necatrix]|uniref:DNA-(apurinic or apyrimidinic site) lyase n=1 Tax=Rosellinia necatrix TaxID=77044 RepID=A0A1W2TDI6_ROSNE|nr:putative N-glycosylase DNA lyase [Rosellinia necatrix]